MITKISIENFKSLKHIDLECSNLNLLTGLNGMGKSSVLQTLLLLKQSYDKGYLQNNGLTLKGDFVNIGVGKDALCQSAEKEVIKFDLSFFVNNNTFNKVWAFGYNADSDVLLFTEVSNTPKELDRLALFNSNFQYLNADRWVRNQYDKSDFQVAQNRSVGIHGEFTPHYLEYYGTKEVNPLLLHPEGTTKYLQDQVSAWMSEISPGTLVKTEKIKGIQSMRLGYEFKHKSGSTDEIAPTNVGFGITYVLSIVVAILGANAGDIVLIENPEAHLHPTGQATISRLISLAAESGVQLFIETHSDHIINGVLVSINQNHKGISKGIQSKNVKIHFIERDEEKHIAKNSPIKISEDGRVQAAPSGFFDQFSKDMKTIMGF